MRPAEPLGGNHSFDKSVEADRLPLGRVEAGEAGQYIIVREELGFG